MSAKTAGITHCLNQPNIKQNITQLTLKNERATTRLAETFAQACDLLNVGDAQGLVVYLHGDLGAGKSFFSRAFIQYFLPEQKVKSPTYTLVESYNASKLTIHHFDLYRLCDPEELEYLAIRDLLVGSFVALVEWPQKGAPILPSADIVINLQHLEDFEALEAIESSSRTVDINANSPIGEAIVTLMLASLAENGEQGGGVSSPDVKT